MCSMRDSQIIAEEVAEALSRHELRLGTVLDGFRNMIHLDLLDDGHVGNGAAKVEDTRISAEVSLRVEPISLSQSTMASARSQSS